MNLLTTTVSRVLNLLLAGTIAGITLGIWIGFNPSSFSYEAYREHQQQAIASLNTLMPILGLITIAFTLLNLFQERSQKMVRWSLWIAIFFLMLSGLITKFGNQPINTIVVSWDKDLVPLNWTQLRDRWWIFHILRTIASVLTFILLTICFVRKD